MDPVGKYVPNTPKVKLKVFSAVENRTLVKLPRVRVLSSTDNCRRFLFGHDVSKGFILTGNDTNRSRLL